MHLCREGEREQGEYISSDTGARPSMCPTTVGHGGSSVSLSVVYSSTTAQPRSEWLALLISFYLSAINFLFRAMCSLTLFSFSSVAAKKVVVVTSSFLISSKAWSITWKCSWFSFFLKLKGFYRAFWAADSAAFFGCRWPSSQSSTSFVSKVQFVSCLVFWLLNGL